MDISDLYPTIQNPIEDSPRFASQALIPLAESGLNSSFIGPFVPSYFFELLKSASAGKIDKSHIALTLVVPRGAGDGDVNRLIYKSLFRFIPLVSDQILLKHLLNGLISTKQLELKLVLTAPEKKLTETFKGLITPASNLDRRYVVFDDTLPGDFNSPITLIPSWDLDQRKYAVAIKDLFYIANLHGTQESAEKCKAFIQELAFELKPKKRAARKKPLYKEDEDEDEEIDLESLVEELSSDWEEVDNWDEQGSSGWLQDAYFSSRDPFSGQDYSLEDLILEHFDSESLTFLDDDDVLAKQYALAAENAHIGPIEDFDGSMIECWCGEAFEAMLGCPKALPFEL